MGRRRLEELNMLHHLGVFASNFEASRAFYIACLQALDINPQYQTDDVAEFWRPDEEAPSLSLERTARVPRLLCVRQRPRRQQHRGSPQGSPMRRAVPV